MKKIKLISFLVFTLFLSMQQKAQLSFENYALENVNIIDVNNQTTLEDYTLVIRQGKIFKIIPSSEYIKNDSTQTFNFKGKYIVPGLIDAHVHMATDPTSERRDDAEITLKKMLLSGVTSVRDMAGDARALSSLSRDALVGDIDAPNVYYSSLMAGTVFFTDPRTIATAQGGVSGQMPYMKAINDSTNIPFAVAEAKGTGAAGIKLYANLTSDQMKAICTEAKQQNFPVWAHAALVPTKPSEVIESGVISFSHASMLVYEKFEGTKNVPQTWFETDLSKNNLEFWDKEYEKLNLSELYQKIKIKNVILDATMSLKPVYENNPRLHWKYEMSKRITRDAKNAGVLVAAGTDSDQKSFVQEEMKLLVFDCKFTPMEAIIAATKNSAQATGILKSEGTIEEGKTANLLILHNNPVDSIENIDTVYKVIKQGKIYDGKK